MLVFIFGLAFIFIDLIVKSFTEGLREIGYRFVVAGIVSISIGYLYRYHKPLRFIMSNLKKKITKQDRFSEWGRP
ncbi:MAG: hypothetical protein M3162_05065 [Thermoproteota archaeon]|nr:hypothetical protein [Thermoproteota archaeon]